MDDVGEKISQLQQDRPTIFEESAKIAGFSSMGVEKRVSVLLILSDINSAGSRQRRITKEVRILDELVERVMESETGLLQMQ